MTPKVLEKAYAVALRKKGCSYNEILQRVPVARSTLSLWLRDVPLSEEERRLLKHRTSEGALKGRLKAAAAHRSDREERDRKMFEEMRTKYASHKSDPFFVAGIILYWAEGAKRSGGAFFFMNSDENAHILMLDWLEKYFEIPRGDIGIRLYARRPVAHERKEEWWAKTLNIPLFNFRKTVFKPASRLAKKRPDYRGCPRLELTRGLNGRKMGFLTDLFLEDYRARQ